MLLGAVALVPGCGTVRTVNNLATGIVSTAANTAVKALSPSTYTGGGNETYNSREPLKRQRGTMSSRQPSKTSTKRSHSKTDNPPIGMPYRSHNYSGKP